MRVLYLLWNYPQISETYIDAEIAFAIRHGVEVHVWSPNCRHQTLKPACPVHRGKINEALVAAKPDVVHCHYLPVAEAYSRSIPQKIPITVRGHSFDWAPESLRKVAAIDAIRRIYLFPHFADQVRGVAKVRILPVAFNPRPRHDIKKDRRLVLRLAAGLPTKGLPDFFEVAERLADDFKFILGVSRAGGNEDYPDKLLEMSKKMGGLVDVRVDVMPDEAWDLYRSASIYLDTSDPKGHPFGMPISIVEAWSQGMLVLARRDPASIKFVGGEAYCYKTPAEAAALVAETLSWTEPRWAAEATSARHRAQPFVDEVVLPPLLEDWKILAEGLP
jgi:glycosyltransferase involved in cell wall biosynthesis